MKPVYIFVFALSLFAIPTFARAPIPPLEPMWVSGEERVRVVQELLDLREQAEKLQESIDDLCDDLRACKSGHSA